MFRNDKLTWTLNDIIEESMDLDVGPNLEALWWTRHTQKMKMREC